MYLLPVADDGGQKQLGVTEELILRRVGGDIRHVGDRGRNWSARREKSGEKKMNRFSSAMTGFFNHMHHTE